MAKFKLNFLTSRLNTTSNVVTFLETPISEFYDQEEIYRNNNNKFNRGHVYCYSFNEKISFHLNGQKELSFSMLRNIWIDNEEVLNPFTPQLKNGSQVLLIDQYNNEYFFTVKNIDYTIQQSNIVYNYTCQDSFTYQHIRQNNGYTIDNSSDSGDFIGAKNIDWWVRKKIQPECRISYQYVGLEGGLYISKLDGNIYTFNSKSNLRSVEKIIKPIYYSEEYPDLHETIPFSVSGSNASAALIALGEELDLMLNFKEHNIKDSDGNRTDSFVRYFWFEPKQNEKTADLKYSPYNTVQSFSFSHSGSSLSTVLNVDANTINDEVVSLIPEISPFFSSLFASTSWKDTLFTNGFFQSICQEKVFLCKDGQGKSTEFRYTNATIRKIGNVNYLYLEILNTPTGFTIPEHYNKVRFYTSTEETEMTVNGGFYSGRTAQWEFVADEVVYNDTYNLLPMDILGTSKQCFIRLAISSAPDNIPVVEESKIILCFYRDATEEDLAFAKIADQCPWLENKLFDFSYFLTNQIISPEEYGILMNSLKNDLRIVNGQLLYYSREYYNAIREKTTILSQLINTLDSLGASFNSDAVEVFKTDGSIKNINYFTKAYDTLYAAYFKDGSATPIMNYNELLTEYFNKYFNAQQRFLKNIYNFEQFFNQYTHWGDNAQLYNNIFSLANLDNLEDDLGIVQIQSSNKLIKRYISFNDYVDFNLILDDFEWYNDNLTPIIKIYNADKITEAKVVDKINYKKFYISKLNPSNLTRCDESTLYNPAQYYYRVAYVADRKTTDWPEKFGNWYKYREDENLVWYCNKAPDATFNYKDEQETTVNPWASSITYQNGDKEYSLTKTFIEVSYEEIINESLYYKLYNEENLRNRLFYKDALTKTDTSEWWEKDDIAENLQRFRPSVFYNSIVNEDWESELSATFLREIENDLNSSSSRSCSSNSVDFYISHFPVTSVEYEGVNYTTSPWTLNGCKLEYQPINSKGQTLTEYMDYVESLYKGISGKDEVINPFDNSERIIRSIPIVTPANEGEYYRRVSKGGLIAHNSTAITLTPVECNSLGLLENAVELENLWNSSTKWSTYGWNTADFMDSPWSWRQYQGWHDEGTIIYAKTMTAYNEWDTIRRQHLYKNGDKEVEINDIASIEFSAEKNDALIQLKEVEIGGVLYYWQYSPVDDNNQYYNLYSKVGLTYSAAQKLPLKFNNGYLRQVSLNEKIDHSANYRILAITANDNDNSIIFSDKDDRGFDDRISKNIYYFIYNNTSKLDIENLQDKVTWGNVFGDSFIYKDRKVIVFQDEDFNHIYITNSTNDWSDGYLITDKRQQLYIGQDIYDNSTYTKYDLSKGMLNGLYQLVKQEDGFIHPTEETTVSWTGDNATKFYYKTPSNTFVRAYSIPQMKSMKQFYYLSNEICSKETIGKSNSFDLKVFLHQDCYNKINNQWILDTEIENTYIKESHATLTIPNEAPDNCDVVLQVVDENKTYSRNCHCTRTGIKPIANISNGQFWLQFHNDTSNLILFEEAATIEMELTQYWTEAYNASLYCEYFLPPSWQPRSNGDINYYNKNIIKYNSNGAPVLSRMYIPEVAIFKANNTIRFPVYELEHTTIKYNDGYSLDNRNGELNIDGYTTTDDLIGFKPLTQALNELNESLSNFVMVDYSNGETSYKKNYYYNTNESTGMKWSKFLQEHSSLTQSYPEFNGLYVMTYRILKNQFKDRTVETYNTCKYKQNLIWSKLYQNYPGVFLEESYSNENATTSEDLLLLATNAFKNKRDPERGYNISLINPAQDLLVQQNDKYSYERYEGQELKIGEGILINADDYYDTYDDIYNTLSQYLFITDISYDLRKDSDIQVTVNSIKYQDKLIQRLVKLIK